MNTHHEKRRPYGRLLIVPAVWAVGAAMALAQPAGGPPAGMGGMGATGPTSVGVVTLGAETVPMTTVLPGRVAASATAEVRPQVGGIVTAVNFTEGQQVSKGDMLITIDAGTYEADVASAQASLQSAQAQLPTAQSKVNRYRELVNSGGIAQTELDTAEVELAQAEASLASAQAQLRIANLTLEQASIKAPISGIVGTADVQVGSLVTANQADVLTTIRQVDPVDITLAESSSNLLSLRHSLTTGGEDQSPPAPPSVTLTLEDGTPYDQTGSVSAADFVVSQTTGSFTIRATMPNPDRLLFPGMFVRATVSIGEQDSVFLVPQRAVTFNSNGEPTAYFVGADGKAEQRVLSAERELNNSWVVTAGVSEGDQLIVDGLQKINPGSEVSPIAVTIEDNGVVYQEAPQNVPSAAAGQPPQAAPAAETTP
jgi:membrane fusion protein, multidrug efflux system